MLRGHGGGFWERPEPLSATKRRRHMISVREQMQELFDGTDDGDEYDGVPDPETAAQMCLATETEEEVETGPTCKGCPFRVLCDGPCSVGVGEDG